MPSMANLALTNNAGTAVVGTVIAPSAGDKVPAQWRVENTAVPPFARSTISMVASANQAKTVRTVDLKIVMPRSYQDTNTGLFDVDSRITATVSFVVPQNIASSLVDDCVAYLRTCLADATTVASLKAQVSPT